MKSNMNYFVSSPHKAHRPGQTLAFDVMNEYVVFLKSEPEKEMTNAEGAGDGG